MAFVVSLPYGVQEYDFAPCVRLLKHDGVNIANTTRVPDPHRVQCWMPAWPSREQAERFAVRLREESAWPNWEVYEVPDSEVSQGPLGLIEIMVKHSHETFIY